MQSLGTLKNDQLLDLSRTVISSLPANSVEDVFRGREKQEMAVEHGFLTVTELNKTVEILFDYWKKALFHAKKPAVIVTDFEEIGISSDGAEQIANMWLEEGAKVMPKAKVLSRSGIPDVSDLRWTLNLERATRFDGQKREPYISLQFDNKDGQQKRCVQLTYEELKQLHLELKEVQRNIDLIFK